MRPGSGLFAVGAGKGRERTSATIAFQVHVLPQQGICAAIVVGVVVRLGRAVDGDAEQEVDEEGEERGNHKLPPAIESH